MFIKTIRNILHKEEHVPAGTVIEVDNDTGKYLVGIKKAVETEKPTKKTEEPK